MASIIVPLRFNGKEQMVDIVSERFLKKRVIYIEGDINNTLAVNVSAQIHYLAERSLDDIYIYISSPGGDISSGFAIIDALRTCPCNIYLIGMGNVSSMASIILASGKRGFRYALPNTEIMLHQPLLGGMSGQASDILIQAEHITGLKKRVNMLLSEWTENDIEKICNDTERDYYLSAQEGKDYGLIDFIGDPMIGGDN